jgi:hypothetical protein
VLKLAIKAELARIREVLGPDGFEIATREAPLLHGALAELDASADPGIFDLSVPVPDAGKRVADFGLGILRRFVGRTEPVLSELMARRCQSDLDRQARGPIAANMIDVHCDQIVRLIRRRMPSWSAIIG